MRMLESNVQFPSKQIRSSHTYEFVLKNVHVYIKTKFVSGQPDFYKYIHYTYLYDLLPLITASFISPQKRLYLHNNKYIIIYNMNWTNRNRHTRCVKVGRAEWLIVGGSAAACTIRKMGHLFNIILYYTPKT